MSEPTHADLHRQIGRLEESISNLKDDVKEIKADQKTLLADYEQSKGRWKAIAMIGGAVGFLASVVLPKLFQKLFG